VIKALSFAVPAAFSVMLMAGGAHAAACAGSGVITRIQGANTDVTISRSGGAVSRIRVLEVVCAGDVVTAKGPTVVTLSIDGVGAVTVNRTKPYTVGPRRGRPSASGNVYRAVSDQVMPDAKRLPWDVRTKGGMEPLHFSTPGDVTQVVSGGRSQLLIRTIGAEGPYEVSLVDASGATVKSANASTEEVLLSGLSLQPGDYRLVAKDGSGHTAEMKLSVQAGPVAPAGDYEDISDEEVVAAIKAVTFAQADPAKNSFEAQQILASAPANGLDRERVYQMIEALYQVDE
jgi:hypothetical protein